MTGKGMSEGEGIGKKAGGVVRQGESGQAGAGVGKRRGC